jgi:hypothetical protein
MVFAYLRSFYSTDALCTSDPARKTTIRWYRAPPGALVFPHQHSFSPLLWSDKRTLATRPLGEVPGAPRKWSNGAPPFPAAGSSFCGQPPWYLTGGPALTDPRPTDPQGIPVCCGGGRAVCQGTTGQPTFTLRLPDQSVTLTSVGGGTWQGPFTNPLGGPQGTAQANVGTGPCQGQPLQVTGLYLAVTEGATPTLVLTGTSDPLTGSWRVPPASIIYPGAIVQLHTP